MLYVGRNERIGKMQWFRIRIHFRISTGSDCFIEAWENGVKPGRVDGRDSVGIDGCGEPQRDPCFKMGVYKCDWKDDRPETDSPTAVYRRSIHLSKRFLDKVGDVP